MRQAEDIGEVLEILVVPGESLASNSPLVEAEGLDLRAHRAIKQQDTLREQGLKLVSFIGHGRRSNVSRSGLCVNNGSN
jgi:hypothetical protein